MARRSRQSRKNRFKEPARAGEHIHFDSLGALIDHATNAPPVWKHRPSRNKDNSTWIGSKSFEAAVSLAQVGWPKGRARMLQGLASLDAFNDSSVAPAFSYDVAGAYPDVALAVSGEPCNMINPIPMAERARPIIKIWIQRNALANVSAREVENYGIALMGHVNRLESDGFSVEITAFSLNQDDYGHFALVSFIAKKSSAIFDPDKMAFILGHPSMHRRFNFAILETFEKIQDVGRGRSPVRGIHVPEGVAVIPGCDSLRHAEMLTVEKASEAIAPVFEKQIKDNFGIGPKLRHE